ncbi:homeobox expressed in ES cells 1 [Hemiscyllium ocellatum]|uniref:homeobox expressed in ES cells 1 n=1 Tax=Hemiscyllium ocellatum TaxID=170820 RepID=UPI0029669A91|nr:homeobox expressed in ES cells 1 [Hemiscyllium ocellatum]
MARLGSCAGAGVKTHSQLSETSKASERQTSKCPFTIESILGLDRSEETAPLLTPHRSWLNITAFPGSSCPDASERFSESANPVEVGNRSCPESERLSEDRFSSRPNCYWFRGRRARTAFSRDQIEVLEEEFQLNCYPGIDVREELAQKLALDEDRIQIWFQNRRAKLKRSHRESQFLMVKNALINSPVQKAGTQLEGLDH